jgi:hypothetical protein
MAVPYRLITETQYGCLAGLDFQVKCSEALNQLATKSPRLLLVLKADDEIVAITHQVRLASTRLLEPPFEP